MLVIIISCVFFWLFFKALGLAWRMAWGMVKIAASVLFTLALPLFIFFLLGGTILPLLAPLAMVVLSFLLLKAVLNP